MFDFSKASVLPPNRTETEAALEMALRKGDPDLSPIAKLLSPDLCPAHLLGWLAWSFSVDVWDADWPEETKREVIRSTIDVHRRKGTKGAVRRALASLDMGLDISEWFEHDGDPHSFRVDAFARNIFDAGHQIDAQLVALVSQLIENIKPVRSQFTLRVGEHHSAPIYARTGSSQSALDSRVLTPAVPVDGHAMPLPIRTGHLCRAVSQQTHVFELGEAA